MGDVQNISDPGSLHLGGLPKLEASSLKNDWFWK